MRYFGEKRNLKIIRMKILISSAFILISFLSFPKKEQKNKIIGSWKMDLYLINLDTIYNEKSEKYTVKYFDNILQNIDNCEEKKIKVQKASNQLYEKFKTVKLHINENTIDSYEFGGTQSKIKLRYKFVDGKIILDKKANLKLEYIIEYDEETDILTIQQGESKIKAINKYSRLTK